MLKKGVYVPSLILRLGRVSFESNLFIRKAQLLPMPNTFLHNCSQFCLHFGPRNHTFDLVKALTLLHVWATSVAPRNCYIIYLLL
jgi:hypothetical protein